MAKTKQQQQQLLVIYLTICLIVVSLLMKVDCVSASSILLDESGNSLQQQQQPQIDNSIQDHNYIMEAEKQSPTVLVTGNSNAAVDTGDDILKEESLNEVSTANKLNFRNHFKPITMVKRTPGGFVGMRGKKIHYDDTNNTENDEDFNYTLPWNQLRNSDEDINWDKYAEPNVQRYKKATTAFYGVRGKKFNTMNGINSNSDNHRWQDFLQKLEGERVRDAILLDFVERLAAAKDDLTNDMTKRTPTGFTGVRGKRPSLDELEYSSLETLSKRGLGNAFVGVRGKKDVSHQTFKRSPAGAESLPGRSGKRQRFVDFNNKFVAVRGKKSSFDDMPALTDISQLYDKRTPKGFLGMRGKRPFTTDDI